jgi:PAS domain S-box-containing protein
MSFWLPPWSPYPLLALALAGGSAAFLLWRRSKAAHHKQDEERNFLQAGLRRAAEALDAAEARFRGAFEQAAVGMNHVSPDGRFLRVNQRYCEITGYSREELLAMTVASITHPDDAAEDRAHLLRLVRGEALEAAWEKRYVRKDGSIIWAALHVTAVRSAGQTPYVFAVVEDITARITAERALRQSEERFRQVVENAPYGIVVERGLEFLYLNPAAARMLGADSAAQLVGTSMVDRSHPEERAAMRERSALVARGSTVSLACRRLLRIDGDAFTAEISATPIVYDGQPAALAFLRDMTVQRQAEEERARLELRLRHAQKMTT